MMSVRHLGFVLLVLFPGALHAQTAAKSCRAPNLAGGYFVPQQEMFSHKTNLTYACDTGRQPAVEGWWATSTCDNGTWSHMPQCIGENACIPPTIPNGKYTESSDGWYGNGAVIRISCDEAYEHKDHHATGKCINGTWSSLPICERSMSACSEPPKVPHAVITGLGYQELFAADSEVQYECEDGYTKQNITCLSGNWTDGPVCSRGREPGSDLGGFAVGGTSGGHTSSGGGPRPGSGHGGTGTTSAGGGTQPTGRRPGSGHGGTGTTSAGSGTRPVGGGSSTSFGSNEEKIQNAPIGRCGTPPSILNGDIVETREMFLKYACNSYYTYVGPKTVVCHSDGTWSDVPSCRATFCSVDTSEYPKLHPDGVKYVEDGEKVTMACVDDWGLNHYSEVRCTDGVIRLSKCCWWSTIQTNLCSGTLM